MLDLEEQLSRLANHRADCVPPFEASTMRAQRRRRSALVAVAVLGAIIAGSLGVLALASSTERADVDRVHSAVSETRSVVLDGPTSDVTARLTPHPNGDLEIEYRRGNESCS